MRLQDFEHTVEANDDQDLEGFLSRRYGDGVNGFWLSHGSEKYPAVSLLVNGDWATLVFLPSDGHPGFTSRGKVAGLKPDGFTTFFLDNIHQKHQVLNKSIVPFAVAVSAAKEFLHSRDLPKSIEWFEL